MSATPTQIKNRLVTLAAGIDGIQAAYDDWPEDQHPFGAQDLPCVIVQVGPATVTRISRARFNMTREFRLLLLVDRTEEDIAHPDTSALEAVEPYLLSVPAYFADKPRLEDASGNGLGVISITLPGDNGMPRIVRNAAIYRGAVFTMTVTTSH